MRIKELHSSIERYIRKYYLFKILRGLIISFSLIFLIYLLLVIFQYYFYFSVSSKRFIFWTFILVSSAVLVEFVFIDFFRLLNLLPKISTFTAAKKISAYFTDFQDKLINILELNQSSEATPLIIASIEQKIKDLKILDFSAAISYKKLSSYLKYLIIPFFVFIALIFYNSSILREGTEKFVNYSVYYEPQAPFDFVLKNSTLDVQQGADLQLELEIQGDIIPDNVNLVFGSNTIPMQKDTKNSAAFKYLFKNLNNSFNFYFTAAGYKSKVYQVKVLPSPGISKFQVKVVPPAYTAKKIFTLENTGDLLVPFGTKLFFSVETFATDSLFFVFDSLINPANPISDIFKFDYTALKSANYKVVAANKYTKKSLFNYNLTVTPDLFPVLNLQTAVDSSILTQYYFHGYINDDYGFSALNFNYFVTDKSAKVPSKNKFKRIPIRFTHSNLTQEFYFIYNFADLIKTDDKIVYYYFSVTDNDAVLGGKTTSTSIFNFYYPSSSELDSLISDIDSSVNEKLQDAQELAAEIQMDIQTFNQKMLNENVSEWEKQSFLENLLDKQELLNSMIDTLKQQNNKKLENIENFKKQNEELLKKQKEIQELLDQLLTDDMKKMLEEMKKLQEEFNQKQFDKIMKNAQMNYEDLNKELDRSHELLKRMAVEQKLQNTIDKLNELSQNQKQLSDNLKNNKQISPQMQDSLLSDEFEFDKLKAEYDSLMKQNSELEKPYDLDSMNSQFDKIKQDFENSKQQMFDNKKNKMQKSMQKTSDDMQEMSQMMQQMMQQNMTSNNAEDIQTIKFLLSNILSFSFTQEKLYNSILRKPAPFSNSYKSLSVKQLSLSSDFKIIQDSLQALAKRNPMISRLITNEVTNISKNLKQINTLFANSTLKNIAQKQRNVIMSSNKLALMLQESLQSMQNSQSMAGSGSPQQSNSKPQPGVGDLKQLQDAMSKQLQQMMEQMKNGQMPSSQQLATQLAQREQFQQMLQEMMNSGNLSDELKQMLEEIQKMNDDVKKDVLNNNLQPETLLRDKKITTKLLDSEKAENKRKYSNKRKSNTSEDILHEVPVNINDYFKQDKTVNDIFNKNILFLNPFYKQYYNEYVIRLGH